jgi:hypothetical protein
MLKADNLTIFVCLVLKSGSLSLLETSGPLQTCIGIALSCLMCIWFCIFENNAYLMVLCAGPSGRAV